MIIQAQPLHINIGRFHLVRDTCPILFSERYGYRKAIRFMGLKVWWNVYPRRTDR